MKTRMVREDIKRLESTRDARDEPNVEKQFSVVDGNVARHRKHKASQKASGADIERAFEWVVQEMEYLGCRITEKVHILNPEGYSDPDDATVALFYDSREDRALLRVNWEDGRIRYDEVGNFRELRFKNNDFTNHLLNNGIRLCRVYSAFGIYEF